MALDGKDIRMYSQMVESGNAKVVEVVNVWSNGKVIRRYQGQDKSRYNYSTSSAKGFRKMTAILVEEGDE